MEGVAHDPAFARKVGIPQSVGKDFAAADKGRKFADGGAADTALRTASSYAQKRAMGGADNIFGGASPGSATPWFERREAAGEDSGVRGFLAGTGGGRSDYRNASLPSGSYILPADIISGMGEGNSLAGAAIADKMFHTEPYGITPPKVGAHRASLPTPRAPVPREPVAKGGAPSASPKQEPLPITRAGEHMPVDVVLADGEFALSPDTIAHHPQLGRLDPNDKDPQHFRRAVKIGHDVLDHWVVEKRKEHAAEMLKLAGPVGAKKHPAVEQMRAAAKVLEAKPKEPAAAKASIKPGTAPIKKAA